MGYAQAQVPGYVGKRMVFSGGVTMAPSILYGFEEDLWGPNIKLNTRAEWVASRKFSLSLEPWLLRTKARYANDQLEAGFAQVGAMGLQLGLRFYHYKRTGIPSPLGAYHEIGFGYLTYRLKDLDGLYRPGGPKSFGPFPDWNVYYRLGTRHIINDWLSWEVAAELGTLISIPHTDFRSQVTPLMLGRARLIRHMALGLHAGLGVVLGGKSKL